MRPNSPNARSFSPVKPDVDFPQEENRILSYWDQARIFEQTLEKHGTLGDKSFSFYDGPPFATGLPHYGHILAGVLKDIVPRYWTMKGYRVPRVFGWDCHGLPVEFEINKAHQIESRKQVLEMGVAKYNALCRGIVQRYSEEWKRTVRRVGRWVDMDNAYFTMNPSFMQSVWWVFQELWKKGLIYEGYKVVPYSTGISTALSNFEANLNYKDVQDPAITITFPVLDDPKTALLAWTTTPWTLPSNLALAVHQDTDYSLVKTEQTVGTADRFWVATALVESNFGANAEILATKKGAELVGLKVKPLFPYFAERSKAGAFRVIHSDHVTTESGTGIVHMAPAFGEDDYYACRKANIEIVNPIDDDGCFTAEVADYQGMKVKDADKAIITRLKQEGRLFKQDTLVHSYPFCWRSDTPLIYRAVSSWFVSVEKIKDELIASNASTHWVPDHLRDGRFGKWLENARDWAISRNRFWGTPIPVWKNVEGEVVVVGSKAELEKLTGQTVSDLHMEFIDHLTIPSPTGKSPLKRVDVVLDCWFESGSMPMAQWGYPFANQDAFEKTFPADFIAEGLDQTRGWFYTLMVIGTALYGKAPFKNVVVNGLILAEDGKKMSKSLRNYPDPNEVLEKHGADALRLYLIDSPVVKAQELRFSEKGVHDVVRKILLRWWNAYAFFVSYANVDHFKPRGDAALSPNLLDRWLLSRLNGLIETTDREMGAYRLYNVVPALLRFIEELTNTYIRFNRPHFWKEGMPEDKRFAYETLYETLVTLSRIMAPFAPFISETIFQNLTGQNFSGQNISAKDKTSPHNASGSPQCAASVHLESFPKFDGDLIQPELEDAVRVMEALVVLGRNHREKIKVKGKIPLRRLRVLHRDQKVLDTLRQFQPYFQEELNIQKIEYSTEEDTFVQITAKANFPVLGKRVGTRMKEVAGAIQKLSLADLLKLESGESVTVAGESITLGDVEIRRAAQGNNPNVATHELVSFELDPTVTPEQQREGLAREVLRKIQQARKNADLQLDQRIRLDLYGPDVLKDAVEAHRTMLQDEALAQELHWTPQPQGQFSEQAELEEGLLSIAITPLERGATA